MHSLPSGRERVWEPPFFQRQCCRYTSLPGRHPCPLLSSVLPECARPLCPENPSQSPGSLRLCLHCTLIVISLLRHHQNEPMGTSAVTRPSHKGGEAGLAGELITRIFTELAASSHSGTLLSSQAKPNRTTYPQFASYNDYPAPRPFNHKLMLSIHGEEHIEPASLFK